MKLRAEGQYAVLAMTFLAEKSYQEETFLAEKSYQEEDFLAEKSSQEEAFLADKLTGSIDKPKSKNTQKKTKLNPKAPLNVNITAMVKELNISANFLEKICLKLKNFGLIDSKRGAKGGYFLKRDPKDISIVEILTAVDTPLKSTKCKGKKNCLASNSGSKDKICRAHKLWSGLEKIIYSYLENIYLFDLLDNDANEKIEKINRIFNPLITENIHQNDLKQ